MIGNAPSLRGRLLRIVLLTTVAALAIALLASVLANAWAFHRQNLLDLETQAELVGRMTSPALAFDDSRLARDNLSLFKARPRIRAAALYDASGKVFSSYLASSRPGLVPPMAGPAGAGLVRGDVRVFKPIVSQGVVIGTVYLQADSGVPAAFLRGSLAALPAGLLAMALAWLLLRRLVPIVTVPIAAMSSVARRVVDERDYSRRVVKLADDEVGGLVDAFNAMLEEVEARTEQLRDSLENLRREAEERRVAQVEVQRLNEQLEYRVATRTHQLERSNQALIAAKAAAEEASRAKSNFLATMSHEIRTPMNGVIGMIDVLHQSSLRADQVEMADLIRDSALSLLSIIEDILDFSKIEAGRMDVEAAPIDIGDVVEGACAMLSHISMRKGVELCMFVDPRIPSPLLGDPVRLRQVVVNLVANAIKFSSGLERPGRVRVRAELVRSSGGRERVAISVVDNGVGMDAKTQARLFTAFSQSDSSTTRRYGGSGLGLAISHRLVEMMGGELTARSELAKGAAFAFELELDHPDGTVHWNAPPQLPSIAGVPCLVVGCSGLVADMEAYLDAAGCRVERVEDMAAAIAQVAGAGPGRPVVVLDAHGLDHLRGDSPDVADLLQATRGIIAVRHHVRRQWSRPDPRYLEIDCAALTRRMLVCSVSALDNGRTPREGEAMAPLARRALTQDRETALRQGRLILVAEDNEFNQQVIVRQMHLLGYAADIAPDGAEAFERWQSVPYGLVLTDLHMPGIDGYELAKRIRTHASPRSSVPILALTANALKGEADRCSAAGMNSYLTKPILLDELGAELARWLPSGLVEPTPDGEPDGPPIVAGVLENFVGNDPAAVDAFLARFEANAEDIATLLEDAWARGDTATIATEAHSLKSAAHMAGATRIAVHCAKAELLAREQRHEPLRPVLDALREAVDCLHAHLAGADRGAIP